MDESTRHAMKSLCEEVLASTDYLLDATPSRLTSMEVAHLVSLRVRARQALSSLPHFSQEEERARALIVERWGTAPRPRPQRG